MRGRSTMPAVSVRRDTDQKSRVSVIMSRYAVIITLVVMGLAFWTSEASVAIEADARAPGNPGMCYSKSYRQLMKIGKEYQVPNACGRMTCNKAYEIHYAFCGTVSYVNASGNCKLVEDRSLPYPECCPKPVCD